MARKAQVFRDAFGNDDALEQLRSGAAYVTTFGAHTVGLGGRFSTTTSALARPDETPGSPRRFTADGSGSGRAGYLRILKGG